MIWKQSKKPQSVLSDAQLKDVKLGFIYTVVVLAVNASNIILKRTHLAEKREWPGSPTVTSGGLVAWGHVGNRGAQKKWIRDKKRNGGGGGTPTFLPGTLLGTRGLRRWSSSTQVSYSAGPSVQLGSGPNSLTVCLSGEMWRRHNVTVAQMPTGETKYSSQASYSCCHFTEELALSLPASFNVSYMQLFAWLNILKQNLEKQGNETINACSSFFYLVKYE